MMRTTSKFVKCLAALSALLPFCTSGLASIVYDNSFIDLNRSYGTNGVEFGDEVTLAGTDRRVNNFKFEYFLSSNASGNETVQLTLHANDGPVITRTVGADTIQISTPGTVLYTSPVLSLQTGYQTAQAEGFSVDVPDTLTWTVTFQGLEAGEVAGLILKDPPTLGSSFADFWQKNGGTWNTQLIENGTIPANFAARISAVPEPTTLALGLLAGLSCMGYLGFKRRL